MMSYGLAWLLLIAFVLGMYIILDGFTLGIGLLFPWFKDSHDRHAMMEPVLPVWDGNETWLVFAGAALYAGFPLAFSIILGAFYIPGMLLVVGLLFRGISFEFLHKTTRLTRLWEGVFSLGSFFAVVAQGIIMAALPHGFTKIENGYLPNALFSWSTVITIVGLLAAYSALAAAKLGNNATDVLKINLVKICKSAHIITAFLVIIALWAMKLDNPVNNLFESVMIKAVISLILLASVFYSSRVLKDNKFSPQFFNLVGVFLIVYLFYVLSLLPFVVPFQLTFQQVQSDDSMLKVMLIGALIFIPLILINTRLTYRLFSKARNKNENKITY